MVVSKKRSYSSKVKAGKIVVVCERMKKDCYE